MTELKNMGVQLPQILLMENVPQVHGTGNKDDFDDWCNFLLSLGYNNKWADLNAKDYGIPQNRDRTFMVSWLGDYYFDFPQPKKLTLMLRDMLEKKVDEKYYLSEKTVMMFTEYVEKKHAEGCGFDFAPTTGVGALNACERDKGEQTITISLSKNEKLNGIIQIGRAVTNYHGVTNREGLNAILEMEEIKCEQIGKLQGGKFEKMHDICRRVYNKNKISPTIPTMSGGYLEPKIFENNYRIRKLTPLECWRLMGFSDDDFDKAKSINSDSQLYKQAGNSIVVNVLMEIFRRML